MIVINGKYGQLSNRLILISHGMARGFNCHEKIIISVFADLEKYYLCENITSSEIIIKGSEILNALGKALQKIWPEGTGRCQIGRDITMIYGWNHRDCESVVAYADALRHFFTPREQYIVGARDILSKVDNKSILVGIHVRRGDYQQFQGGIYYFSNDVYENLMKRISLLLDGKRITFIVFSNEQVELSNNINNATVIYSDLDPVGDHWLMSKCDYLAGPPSTFSLWASFMGKVPLAFIQEKNDDLKMEDFVSRSL